MPETPVHEHRELVAWENKIGTAWKVCPVQPEAIAGLMQPPPHLQFGAGVLASDASHVPATLRGSQLVGHAVKKELPGACVKQVKGLAGARIRDMKSLGVHPAPRRQTMTIKVDPVIGMKLVEDPLDEKVAAKPKGGKAAAPAAESTPKQQSVGELIRELLTETDLEYSAILDRVRVAFPDAKTTVRSIASVACLARKKGLDVPKRRAPKPE